MPTCTGTSKNDREVPVRLLHRKADLSVGLARPSEGTSPWLARPTNALIGDAMLGHAGRPVDVAQVDDHGRGHLAFQAVEVERACCLTRFPDFDSRAASSG